MRAELTTPDWRQRRGTDGHPGPPEWCYRPAQELCPKSQTRAPHSPRPPLPPGATTSAQKHCSFRPSVPDSPRQRYVKAGLSGPVHVTGWHVNTTACIFSNSRICQGKKERQLAQTHLRTGRWAHDRVRRSGRPGNAAQTASEGHNTTPPF